MQGKLRGLAAGGLLLAAFAVPGALAQRPGGVLRMYHFDSPAGMSLHEEVTFATLGPMMGVFNNLVMYQHDVAQASLQSIVPEIYVDGDLEPIETANWYPKVMRKDFVG